MFAVSEAKHEVVLVGLWEAGYVVVDAKSWAHFHLLSQAECEVQTVSVLGWCERWYQTLSTS